MGHSDQPSLDRQSIVPIIEEMCNGDVRRLPRCTYCVHAVAASRGRKSASVASKGKTPKNICECELLREIDDKTLLMRFYRHGDDDALAAFVGRHRGWAVAKAREYYAEEAEDVVQTSILRLMDSTPANGEVANPLGWWSVIISTAAMDALRRTMRRRRREQESLRFREPIGEPVVLDMAESVARTLLLEAVTAEIDALEDYFRGPLMKRYFEGLSYREIAEALDCKPGTAASRLSRGIARLRDGLVAKGVLELSSQDLGGNEVMPDVLNGTGRLRRGGGMYGSFTARKARGVWDTSLQSWSLMAR